MTDYLGGISRALESKGISHDCYHDCIHSDLPDGFGVLEVKVWDGTDDSIQLLGGDFHSHGDQLVQEFGLPREEAIAVLFEKIIYGDYLLIEECEPGKPPRKTIEQSLEHYLKYLPPGTEYRIANKI